MLRETPLLHGLAEPSLVELAPQCRLRSFRRGQYLWYQGDPGDRLVIVATGLVKVVVATEQGDESVLLTMGRGAVLGELAVLDGRPRSASAVAVEPTTVVELTRPAVSRLLADHPIVLEAMLSGLTRTVRRLTEQLQDMSYLDLPGRLAKVLLRLGRQHDAAVLDLGMSQSELAAMVGASRPAVNRALHGLADRGLIEINGKVIVLRDPDGLRDRAGY